MTRKQPRLAPDQITSTVENILEVGRVPGAALAITSADEVLFAAGFGSRSVSPRAPMTVETLFPIASTTKAINATLLGMLVDDGRLEWDKPIQHYLPEFRLSDPQRSSLVTIRDLLAMRTGLPRHDWLWAYMPMARTDLVHRFAHLELTSGFRERFQYNNLTVTLAGHIAEVVTGRRWEDLVHARILMPLGMSMTVFEEPEAGELTQSWHAEGSSQLVLTGPEEGRVTAPSGGAIHSTVSDMAKWAAFNLKGGLTSQGDRLIEAATFSDMHRAQMVIGDGLSSVGPHATYGLGWTFDTYNGCQRVFHGGYHRDVNSDLSLFPNEGIGIFAFVNFGATILAPLISQHVFDALMGFTPETTVQAKIDKYQRKVEDRRTAVQSMSRILDARPAQPLTNYCGLFRHPGYGDVSISLVEERLCLRRGTLELMLEHWHYDCWVAAELDHFGAHEAHPFDASCPLQFVSDPKGDITELLIKFEPEISAVRFRRVVEALSKDGCMSPSGSN